MLSARGVRSAEPQRRSRLTCTAPSVAKATRRPGETDAAPASGGVSTRGGKGRASPAPPRARWRAELAAPQKRVVEPGDGVRARKCGRRWPSASSERGGDPGGRAGLRKGRCREWRVEAFPSLGKGARPQTSGLGGPVGAGRGQGAPPPRGRVTLGGRPALLGRGVAAVLASACRGSLLSPLSVK